jgi:citrate lyase subunit beta/citryl-CoA lyase
VDIQLAFKKNREMISISDLRLVRTLLFLPASNPRAIEKARGLAADMIVLDLEDAVKPADKDRARAEAVAAVRAGFGGRPVAIRANGRTTPWYGEDALAIRDSGAACAILPKPDTAKEVRDFAYLAQLPVLAMIETARGVLGAEAIAPLSAGLVAGTNDLAADLAIPPGAGRAGLAHSLQRIVLAARAHGIAAFDGVYNRLDDEAGLAEQCREGRAFGFDGKSLIHPSQIEVANRLFGPSDEELDAAARLVAAATGGAERFEGRMIETLHVDQARAVLAKARR